MSIRPPKSNLLCRQGSVIGEVASSSTGFGVPHTHKVLAAAVDELRYRPARVIAKNTEIETVINRPRANFREAMRRGKAHGVDNLRIIPCLDASVVPPVETMPHVAPVAE